MEKRYHLFRENERETWLHRFTWRGIYGDKAYFAINIFRFFSETKSEHKLLGIKNSNAFYNAVSTLANEYVQWVKTKESHEQTELIDLGHFFSGAIGEFFYTYLFNEVGKIITFNKDGIGKTYDFHYVAPLLKGENDFGIDLTGVVSDRMGDRNCVLQVKFWNPFDERLIPLDVAQKALCEGICNNFIEKDNEKDVFVCWLGKEDVTTHLKENKPVNRHIVVIGKKALNETINNRNSIFWDGIVKKLTNFSNN